MGFREDRKSALPSRSDFDKMVQEILGLETHPVEKLRQFYEKAAEESSRTLTAQNEANRPDP